MAGSRRPQGESDAVGSAGAEGSGKENFLNQAECRKGLAGRQEGQGVGRR